MTISDAMHYARSEFGFEADRVWELGAGCLYAQLVTYT